MTPDLSIGSSQEPALPDGPDEASDASPEGMLGSQARARTAGGPGCTWAPGGVLSTAPCGDGGLVTKGYQVSKRSGGYIYSSQGPVMKIARVLLTAVLWAYCAS